MVVLVDVHQFVTVRQVKLKEEQLHIMDYKHPFMIHQHLQYPHGVCESSAWDPREQNTS